MKQGILPLIPADATDIDGFYSVFRGDTTVTWFHGSYPIRVHPLSDHATQRSMMGFLHLYGGVPQPRIAAALRVHENTVRAAVRLLRLKGDAGFYTPTAVRGPAVMTPAVMEQCRLLLSEGQTRSAVAAAVGIKKWNIDKAIQKGFLPPSLRPVRTRQSSTRSERAEADAAAVSAIGMACVRVEERAMAACGLLAGAETSFEECVDVERGGVLCALPALAANGLFEHLSLLNFSQDGGFYYRLTHVFILLALMALLRVKTVESLRRSAPGEFGKLLGLDRVPEVRCLRERLGSVASNPAAVAAWADALSKSWMEADPDMAGTLYVDGHVRVYHGKKTELSRRYVTSHRLCLRGVTDYWVNDREGKPFFYIDRPVDDGLLAVMRSEIVPRLLLDVPRQPSDTGLEADRYIHRFRLIFDRAGCSYKFVAEMWSSFRVACMTYLKSPDADWPETEFRSFTVTLANGGTEEMKLAERGTWFGSGRDGIWCRQFRRLRGGRHGSHQTAIIGTDYKCLIDDGVPAMFARWGQENFFRYMLAEFGLDLLADYSTEVFPCRIPVVNPAWRTLDGECRTLRGKIAVEKGRLADLTLEFRDMEPGRMEKWIEKKSGIAVMVADIKNKLEETRLARKNTPKHIPFDELPAEHKFERLNPTRKLALDTVRMIAYRAETAIAAMAAPELSSPEEARSMVKAMFNTTVNLHPDTARKKLRVVLHPLAETRLNKMAEAMLVHLNEAKFTYPGTELQMVYEMLTPIPSSG
ncbi:MAG: putative transposase [Victivallaceae bacterium]